MFEERIALADGRHMEARLMSEEKYSLSTCRGNQVLVQYGNFGKGHFRRLRGKESAYEFRSVEQLRYDFEQDAKDAQHPG
jgi:hypothetical protein